MGVRIQNNKFLLYDSHNKQLNIINRDVKMDVKSIIFAYPGEDPVSYDMSEDTTTKITVDNKLISIDFIFEGTKWTRRIPVENLRFFEYPSEPFKELKISEENIYRGQSRGRL